MAFDYVRRVLTKVTIALESYQMVNGWVARVEHNLRAALVVAGHTRYRPGRPSRRR